METKETERLLRQVGKRVTPQRMLILETISESGGHLDADEIHLLARRKMPRLSLSTVYRTLSILKEAGVIEELHLGEEHHYYEIKGEGHHHLICQSCGKVVELKSPFSEELLHDLEEEHNFEITGIHLDLVGYCANCKRKQADKAI